MGETWCAMAVAEIMLTVIGAPSNSQRQRKRASLTAHPFCNIINSSLLGYIMFFVLFPYIE